MPQTDFPAELQRYGEFRHCPRCGERFRPQDFRAAEVLYICGPCGFDFYQNPSPASVVVLTPPDDPTSILLLKRRTPPRIGHWCVPGGFIRYGETPEAAAAREVLEEVGARCAIRGVIRAGLVDYLYRGRQICVVEISYLARVAGAIPRAGSVTDEASEIAFKPLADILAQPGILAFPEQGDVLREYAAHLADPASPFAR